MTAALWNILAALMLGLPLAPAELAASRITVAAVERTPVDGASGWIGCSPTACEVELVDPGALRHELWHAVDALSDGRLDGSIAGMDAFSRPAERPWWWCPPDVWASDVEWLAYSATRATEVRPR